MPQEEEQQVSKYNSGINIIMRLDALWKDTHRYSRLGLFSKWNETLDRIWLELARDIKASKYEKEFEDKNGDKHEGYKKVFDSFDEKMKKQLPIEDSLDNEFKKRNPDQIKKRDEQYKVLMEKELFLRRLENELGKGTAWDDDDEDGFD